MTLMASWPRLTSIGLLMNASFGGKIQTLNIGEGINVPFPRHFRKLNSTYRRNLRLPHFINQGTGEDNNVGIHLRCGDPSRGSLSCVVFERFMIKAVLSIAAAKFEN